MAAPKVLLLLLFLALLHLSSADRWLEEGRRPLPWNRRFNSSAVEQVIEQLAPKLRSPVLARLFTNCFPNTLDTTVEYDASGNDTFVITGDISAMWLRDSTNQVLPYLPLVQDDRELQAMLCGVVRRQTALVLIDPYSNAFNRNATKDGPNQDDVSYRSGREIPWPQRGHLFEQKYELDSLAAVLRLVTSYFSATGDAACFESFAAPDGRGWADAMRLVLRTIAVQQRGTADEAALGPPAYTFQRKTGVATDTLMKGGRGVPARRTNMSKTYFRPSDDAVTLPFLVPANAMAVVELRALARMLQALARPEPASGSGADPGGLASSRNATDYQDMAEAATRLAGEIDQGIKTTAVVSHPGFGEVLAYEVDGFGSSYKMDDANVPSLLSLPLLGYMPRNHPLYVQTRRMVLSGSNPFFFRGAAGEGIGGPHQGYNMIWPMSVIVRALTSQDDGEIEECLQLLETSATAGRGFIHESFNADNASIFTRPWFAWANGLFGQLVLTLAKERPHLVLKPERWSASASSLVL